MEVKPRRDKANGRDVRELWERFSEDTAWYLILEENTWWPQVPSWRHGGAHTHCSQTSWSTGSGFHQE